MPAEPRPLQLPPDEAQVRVVDLGVSSEMYAPLQAQLSPPN